MLLSKNGFAASSAPNSAPYLIELLRLVPPSFGVSVFLALAAALAWVVMRKPWDDDLKVFFSCAVLSVAGFLVLTFLNVPFTYRFFELAIVSAVVFSGIAFAKIMDGLPKSKVRGRDMAGIALFLVLGMYFSLSSAELSNLRGGTKMDAREFAFAQAFERFDPTLSEAAYLADAGGKISEYANKIPFDVVADWTLAAYPEQANAGPALDEVMDRHELAASALKNGCASCMELSGVDYLVIDREAYPDAVTAWKKVFMANDFEVYVRP